MALVHHHIPDGKLRKIPDPLAGIDLFSLLRLLLLAENVRFTDDGELEGEGEIVGGEEPVDDEVIQDVP